MYAYSRIMVAVVGAFWGALAGVLGGEVFGGTTGMVLGLLGGGTTGAALGLLDPARWRGEPLPQ